MSKKEVIRDFPKMLRDTLGHRIIKIVLFGSHARGDSWEGSDYDFLILIDKRDEEIEDKILDIQVEMLDRYEILVVSIIQTPEEWEREEGFPLAINIEREGKVL